MAVVYFKTSGGLALDASGAGGNKPTEPLAVQTSDWVVDPKQDLNWQLAFAWDANNACSVTIVDVGTNNASGPNELSIQTMDNAAVGAVYGRSPDQGAPSWALAAADGGADDPDQTLDAFPVELLPSSNEPNALVPENQGEPGDGGGTRLWPQGSWWWLLTPRADWTAPSSWLQVVVWESSPPEPPAALNVANMLIQLWQKCAAEGGAWNAAISGSLIWWAYEYPQWQPDSSQWLDDAQTYLYGALYEPYVDQSGDWGSGDPPNIVPPGVR